jgi:Zn-dependent protease/CBS domain-containing protein
MSGSLTLGHVRSIPIRAHFTLLFVLPYLAFLMATQFVPVARQAGVLGEAVVLPPLAWGMILAVLLFGCVLLHELGHALVALRFGGRVSSITLMLLGGVSELAGLPKTPRVEGLVAVAGPIVSLLLGGLALGFNAVVHGPPDLRFGLYYLGQINLALAIFNILPAFPMDGGRVLRAVLATRWPRVKATRIASGAGAVFAALFVLAGFLSGNLILMLVGLFVWSGAQAETQAVVQEEQFRGLCVRDVMSRTRDSVDASAPVAHAAELMAEKHVTALPVTDGVQLVGIVAAHHLEALSPAERARVLTAAVTARDVPHLEADELLNTALERMAEHRTTEALVLDDGTLVGVLETSDLGRTLRLHRLAEHGDRHIRFPRPPMGDRPGPFEPASLGD